jgi:hypothetical protein
MKDLGAMLRSLLISGICMCGFTTFSLTASRAADEWMNESELKAVFAGKGVDGRYRSGGPFAETYGADGHVDYEDEVRTSGGHWSIQAGTFCTIYDDDSAGGCFQVRRRGSNCFEFFFVAPTEEEALKSQAAKPQWTARAWVQDQPSTCKEEQDV